MLGVMALALRAGKHVFFVNAMLSDCPRTGRNQATVGRTRDLFATVSRRVPDPESIEYLRTCMPGVTAELIPDALFAWQPDARQIAASLPPNGNLIVPFPERPDWLGRLDFARPFICVGGSAAAQPDRAGLVGSYVALVERLGALGANVVLTENDGPDQSLEKWRAKPGRALSPSRRRFMRRSRCWPGPACSFRDAITRRFWPPPAERRAFSWESSAHKMRSLQRLLEYPERPCFPACPVAPDVDKS